jgi:hypothetical protein
MMRVIISKTQTYKSLPVYCPEDTRKKYKHRDNEQVTSHNLSQAITEM